MVARRSKSEIITVEHCSARRQICCSLILLTIIFALGVTTIMYHYAVSLVATPLQNFDDTVIRLVTDVFDLEHLNTSIQTVSNASATGLLKCDVHASVLCPTDRCHRNCGKKVDASMELVEIKSGFSATIDHVQKLAADPIWGVREVIKLRDSLHEMRDDLDEADSFADDGVLHCQVLTPAFCKMQAAISKVPNADSITNNILDQSEEVDQYLSYLDYLYLLPYILLLATAFYLCFWFAGGVCMCGQKGICCRCCPYLFYLLFGSVSFVLTTVLFTAVMILRKKSVGMIDTEPEYQALLRHVYEHLPENSSSKGFVRGFYLLFRALLFLDLLGFALLVYSILVCISGVYVVKHKFGYSPTGEDDEE